MDAKTVIMTAIETGFAVMDAVMGGVTEEQAHWTPPGTAQTIAATYAHALVSTDWQIHTLFEGRQGMWETTWQDKTGVTPPSPAITEEWGKTVQVDLEVVKAYDAAVRQAVRDYVNNADLDRIMDFRSFGNQSLAWALISLVAGHWSNLAGEISALKGVQGLKGYPF